MAYRINNKITFLHIPKTAGTSITEWIRKYTVHHFDGDTHKNIDLVRSDWLDQTFCVVRNPWQRAISSYYFNLQVLRKKARFSSMHDFVRKQLMLLDEGFESFVLNHADYYFTKSQFVTEAQIRTLKSNSQVSYIGKNYNGIVLKFETLKQDFEKIQDIVGCKSPLPHLNNNDLFKKDKWKKMYTTRSVEKISQIWADDIKCFGYSFD